MARYNPRIANALRELIQREKLNPNSMALHCEFTVSKTAIQNWLQGQEPTRENLLAMLSYFPNEDTQEWLRLYEEQVVAA